MEFTNKVLSDMRHKKALYNRKFGAWYYGMYKEDGGEIRSVEVDGKIRLKPFGNVPETNFNKGDRICGCCDLWLWNLYEKNKLLDLKKLNRCMNSRFCPNCKMLNVQKFIHEFKQKIPQLEDYDCYLLTLTVPSENCDGARLREMIDKLYSCFRRLNHKFSAPLFTPTGRVSGQALQSRHLVFSGGVRVLEITYNDEGAGFHPHLHCVVCVPKSSVDEMLLVKDKVGRWSKKRQSYNLKSDVDLQIGKAWSMLWHDIDFRKWESVDYSCSDTYMLIDDVVTEFKNLEVDFTTMDDGGIYEVFKYTFKSSEVSSYGVFKALNEALAYKRIRQGFGLLSGMKVDDDSEGKYQDLELDIEEEPTELLTREFDELLTKFAEYRKISRYNPSVKEDFLLSIAD